MATASTPRGKLIGNGEKLPDFTLVDKELKDVTLADFTSPLLVLNIFPSVDTGTCAASVRRFNQEATTMDNANCFCAFHAICPLLNRVSAVLKA